MPIPLVRVPTSRCHRFRLVLAGSLIAIPLMSQNTTNQPDRHDHAIRAARARSNAAIAAHDTAAIMREWLPDVHVVTSTSRQTAGAAANAAAMQTQFSVRPDTRWVRTPTRIDVFAPWLVASEAGEWVGTWTDPDGPVRIRGTYLAQWRQVDGQWRIQAEVFVPVACEGGAYCAQRP
jgi:ketosteroid isomerase-like protein